MWYACTTAGGLYPNRTVAADFLTYTAGLIAGLGFNTIRIFLTPLYSSNYPSQNFGSTPTNLTQLAQTTPMAAVLGTTQFTRFVLTAYSFANTTTNPWTASISQAQLDAEYTEIYNLATHLLTTYSNKEFLISDSESDWALMNGTDPTVNVPPRRSDRQAAFKRVQQKAIEDARRDTASTSKVLHVVEGNRILDDWSQRIDRDVLPYCVPDRVSLSIYESIDSWGTGQADAEAAIASKLTRSVARIRAACGQNVPIHFGEFGWPIDEPSFTGLGLDVGALIQKVIDVGNSLGVLGCAFWQVVDNEEQSPGVPRGFGCYSRNGNSTTVGTINAAGTKWLAINP